MISHHHAALIPRSLAVAGCVTFLLCTLLLASPALTTFHPLHPSHTPSLARAVQEGFHAYPGNHDFSTPALPFDQTLVKNYLKQVDNSGLSRSSVYFNYNNDEQYSASIGCLDSACSKTADELTRYRMGSITKTFTAVLTMKAVEEGKLSLDTPLSNFFPPATYPIKYSTEITIRTLLNHRSGLYSYSDAEFDLFAPHTLDDIISTIVAHSSTQPPPDTIGAYGNSGYYLMGEILSIVYGKPFRDVLNEKIVSPLSLFSTYLTPLPSSSSGDLNGSRPNVGTGETLSFTPLGTFQWVENPLYTDYSSVGAAGALISTPKDLSKFYHGVFIERRIISAASIKQMRQYRPLVDGLNYGFGIFEVKLWNAKNEVFVGFGHNGVVDGFLSYSAIVSAKPGLDSDVLTDGYLGYFDSVNAMNGATQVQNIVLPFFTYMLGTPLGVPYAPNSNDPYAMFYDKLTGVYHSAEAPQLPITLANKAITRPFFNHMTNQFQPKTVQVLTILPAGQVEFPLLFDQTKPGLSYTYDQGQLVIRFDPNFPNQFTLSAPTYTLTYKR